MADNNEMAEIHQRANQALMMALQAAAQLASVAIQARIRQLREAAARGEQEARQVRAQARAWQVRDAAIWRETSRPAWWRTARPTDIAEVWRAATTWRHVDPRAEQARRTVVDKLAERGVHVDLDAGDRPGDVRWLSDALDQAAAVDNVASGRVFDELVDERAEQAAAGEAAESTAPEADPDRRRGPVAAPPVAQPQPATPETVRAEALAGLERHGQAVRHKQASEYPQPRPDSPIWQAYERRAVATAAAVESIGQAPNLPYALRAAAGELGGQIGGRLGGLADRLDPKGRGMTAQAAERARVVRETAAARGEARERRWEEMAGHVRAAWPAERAEKVIGSQAWPVLAHKLDQLDAAGHDVEAMLRAVPSFVDRAHTPAAYAYRVMDDAEAQRNAERAAADAERAGERDERTVEGDWRETTTTPAVAEARAEDAHAAAERHADIAADHEDRAAATAAEVAARGYPEGTDTAVAGASAGAKTAGPTGRAPRRGPARPATKGREAPRTPRQPSGR